MLKFVDADEVAARLSWPIVIPLMRRAMADLSAGRTRQLLREILPLRGDDLFGVMPGSLGDGRPFGAKLISVLPRNFAAGGPSHQGVILLFDPESGAPVCVVDAGEVTALRTAAASAMATDVLARADASRLALLGYGRQAEEHLHAIAHVRTLSSVVVWGRHAGRAAAFASRMASEPAISRRGLRIHVAADARSAAAGADIVCTLTPATEPILKGAWIAPGAHVNLVGAGHAGQAEADGALVARARFFADSRPGVLTQGGEFRRALAEGLVDEGHIAGEIGEVLLGSVAGRRSGEEVTAYKSLGHIAQDLSCAEFLYSMAKSQG